jgi:long-chain acyl-CoA synthetase
MSYGSPIVRARPWQNLVDLFAEFSESPVEFLQYDNGYRSWKYTYAQVGLAARQFAARLKRNNIGKGEKVIIWSENSPEWIAAFWGCVLAGVIVVPIDYRTSIRFLRRVQEIVDARLVLAGEEVGLTATEEQPLVWHLRDFAWTTAKCEAPSVHIDKDDVVEIVFTSGATGEPKGVVITHRNILSNIVSPLRVVSAHRRWFQPVLPLRFLSLIPLSHMFGQMLTIFILPFTPGIAVFMQGYSPHEIVHQVHARQVSVVVCVPKILDVLRKYVLIRFPEVASLSVVTPHWIVRWWRYRNLHWSLGWKFWAFVVGAAPLAKELEEFWSHLGFAVIQGYGLTETAPVVAFNDPFDIKEGTVGQPVAGVAVKIAPDGEILVRGDSVTPGYYHAPSETASAFDDGWFRTGDIGRFDETGHLVIRGRKKEMIVTPDGLNVFPEDVEAVINRIPGVRESAVVGRDRVCAVLVLRDSSNADEVLRRANQQLENYQRIRTASIWPGERLPRTESTQKLKRAEILAWMETGRSIPTPRVPADTVIDLLRHYAPGRSISPDTTLDQLGLSSLDRVELLLDLEKHFEISIDESVLTGSRTVSALSEIGPPPRPAEFPSWNRVWLARGIRHAVLSAVFLPLARMLAQARISGQGHLVSLEGPVIFAPNHQSHLDTPLILSALPSRYRYRVAPAMWKEYFDAHFSPGRHTRYEWLRDSSLYWLVTLFFNTFPVPQTEVGAGQSLRYLGDLVSDNWSILFFPEGERTEAGEIKPFLPGIGLIAARLQIPVVPIRLRGVEKVLHRQAHWPRPGRVEIVFGPPLDLKGKGEDYAALAKQVHEAVLAL